MDLTSNSVERQIHPSLFLPCPFCTEVVKCWQRHRLNVVYPFAWQPDCSNTAHLLQGKRECGSSACHLHMPSCQYLRYCKTHMYIKHLYAWIQLWFVCNMKMSKGGDMFHEGCVCALLLNNSFYIFFLSNKKLSTLTDIFGKNLINPNNKAFTVI